MADRRQASSTASASPGPNRRSAARRQPFVKPPEPAGRVTEAATGPGPDRATAAVGREA